MKVYFHALLVRFAATTVHTAESRPNSVWIFGADRRLELRAALDQWITDTKDLGAIPETELIQRGLVADSLTQYEKRKEPKK